MGRKSLKETSWMGMRNNNMKKALTFLLALILLVLFGGISSADDLQDGVDAYKRGDDKTAYKLFLPLAEKGYPLAQYHMGEYTEKEDYKESLKWYRLSAEQGNADAQNTLGYIYRDGYELPETLSILDKIFEYFFQEYEREKARLYEAEIEKGNAVMITAVVKQDYKESVKWFRLSAEQGNTRGQHGLSSMFEYGRGVPQDYALAHMWLSLSFSGLSKRVDLTKNKKNKSPEEFEEAVPDLLLQSYVQKNGRDFRIVNLEKKMSPTQIGKAQEMAKNWKPKTK